MEYVLAVDIGASSGRHMLGWIEDGELQMQEVHRFKNQIKQKDGHDIWDIDQLYEEIIIGMKACAALNKIPQSIAIDTWACDFVLCDDNGQRLCDCVAYRDARVDGWMEKAFQVIDRETLYQRTGIQFQKFNTLYQCLALRHEQPDVFAKAAHFLMVPDYLNYRLCGVFANEYTNATTTQMIQASSKDWDEEILSAFQLPRHIFHPLRQPGDSLNGLREEVKEVVGYDCIVKVCASHDTGSAFAAAAKKDAILISSGTWSLVGVLNEESNCSLDACQMNFTNEGGVHHSIRFLKNIMGLWMIQEVQRCYNGVYSFTQFVEMAYASSDFPSVIDVNEDRFLHPKHMILEIQEACRASHQKVPQTPGEVAYCIYHSLAIAYQEAIQEICILQKKTYTAINIFGGGCQNALLNELVSELTGMEVYAGPVEATALGNLLMQIEGDRKEHCIPTSARKVNKRRS